MSKLHFTTKHANAATVQRNWYVVDGTNQTVGRIAARIASVLRGKNKAYYTPHVDCGDYVIVINAEKVVFTGNKGEQSFSPNPAMCPAGQTVVWKNADSITHRIVIQDLGIDTGNLAPGAPSQPVALADVSKNYHCSLHPSMIGSLNNATNDPGNCGPYGCY